MLFIEGLLAFIGHSFFSHTIRPRLGNVRKIVNKIFKFLHNHRCLLNLTIYLACVPRINSRQFRAHNADGDRCKYRKMIVV